MGISDDILHKPGKHSGSQFDPDVVAAFLAREEEFRELARRFGDGQDPRSTQREVPAAR